MCNQVVHSFSVEEISLIWLKGRHASARLQDKKHIQAIWEQAFIRLKMKCAHGMNAFPTPFLNKGEMAANLN